MKKVILALFVCLWFATSFVSAGPETVVWKVKVIGARHLNDKDWGIFFRNPDSYVVVSYKPDAKAKFQKIGQTGVQKNNDNPVWNAVFKVNIKADDDKHDGSFKFVLMDKDLFEDDLSGVVTVSARPSEKPIEVKFPKAKLACLKIHIVAATHNEPPEPPRGEKGTWEIKIGEGKHLVDKKGQTPNDKTKLWIFVAYAADDKTFIFVGKTKRINKADMDFNEIFNVKGPEKGTLSFILSDADKHPTTEEFAKGDLLAANPGDYTVKLTGAKKGCIEVGLKYKAK